MIDKLNKEIKMYIIFNTESKSKHVSYESCTDYIIPYSKYDAI